MIWLQSALLFTAKLNQKTHDYTTIILLPDFWIRTTFWMHNAHNLVFDRRWKNAHKLKASEYFLWHKKKDLQAILGCISKVSSYKKW